MRFWYILSPIVTITLCQLLISPSPKIVGGSTAERDEWKFIVRFAYIGCAGSIINPHWIITGF